MSLQRTKQYEFETFVRENRRIVGKVCYLYAMDSDDFDDLYQEVLINLWRGFDGFEGRAKVSSWVYRVALNTCISYYRRNRRHTGRLQLTDSLGAADEDSERGERLRELYALINRLDALEKAVGMGMKKEKRDGKGGRAPVTRRASLRGDRRDHGAYTQQRGFEAPPHQAETA